MLDDPSDMQRAPSGDTRPAASPELRLAAFLGFLGVAIGALGAHAIKTRVSPEALGWWETGARYHLIHAVAMLVVTLAPGAQAKWRRRSARLFAIGIAIFAGTLYAMALGAPRWFGAITPLGGVGLMLGWLALLMPAKD